MTRDPAILSGGPTSLTDLAPIRHGADLTEPRAPDLALGFYALMRGASPVERALLRERIARLAIAAR